jgi:tetratricopeptide (TPR) repeat protein
MAVARATVALGEVDWRDLRLEDAIGRFEAALPTLEQAGAEAELAATLAELGRMQALHSHLDQAAETIDRALALGESLALEELLVHALTTKAVIIGRQGHSIEARLLLEGVLPIARAAGLDAAWWRAANNLAVILERDELYTEMLALVGEVEAQARARGDRDRLASARIGVISTLVELGRWEEALAHTAEADELRASRHARGEAVNAAIVFCERGEPNAARALLEEQAWQRDAEQPEHKVNFAHVEARLLRALDRPAEALERADAGLALRDSLGLAKGVKHCIVEALEAACELGDAARAGALLATLDTLRPGELTPSLEAQRSRFHARTGSTEDPGRDYRRAEAIFGEQGMAFHLAVARLEHAEWLVEQGRTEEAGPLLAEARSAFEELQAKPWLERVDAARAPRRPEVPA